MSAEYGIAVFREAAAEGKLNELIVRYLREPAWANRNLAAIIDGQRPNWEGPCEVPLEDLDRIAGPESERRFPKDPEVWDRAVGTIAQTLEEPLHLPPLIARMKEGRLSLADGNHRLEALRRLGYATAWVLIWRDRDPRFVGRWSPWLEEDAPTIGLAEGEARERAVAFYQAQVRGLTPADEEIIVSAEVRGRVVGAVRLAPEGGSWTLRTMLDVPEYRGRRAGFFLLYRLRPYMEGKRVYCLAYAHLGRFYGEIGFRPIEPDRLPAFLYERYLGYLDAKGCLPMLFES